MSVREEIETNRLLKGILDLEFDKLVTQTPEQKTQIMILESLKVLVEIRDLLKAMASH